MKLLNRLEGWEGMVIGRTQWVHSVELILPIFVSARIKDNNNTSSRKERTASQARD
jgi:hypothetical protein